MLINLGTPDSPAVGDVRRYLREFLMDEHIIDIPFYKRWPLVHLIIAPFRAPVSARAYARLWQDAGSPLLYHSLTIKKKLQEALGEHFFVTLGMRYGKPGIAHALDEFKTRNISRVLAIPLFPQYASATTGSIIKEVEKLKSKRDYIRELLFVENFFDQPDFVNAVAEAGKYELKKSLYDHVIFSFHGVPERQIIKNAPGPQCTLSSTCCATLHEGNRKCYRAQCYATARLMAHSMHISPGNYTVTFQSRLGKGRWLQPYTAETVKKLAREGKKNVLVFSPSFVTDCLETTIELGVENKEIFLAAGGKKWTVVKSLNGSERFITALKKLIGESLPGF